MPRKDFKNSKKNDRPVKSVKSAQKQQKQFKEFNVPVKAGAEYIVNISSLGSSGEGVGRVSDFTVFVNGALPGEEVKAKITEVPAAEPSAKTAPAESAKKSSAKIDVLVDD